MEAYVYGCGLWSAESSLFIIIATHEAMLYRQFCEPSFSFLSQEVTCNSRRVCLLPEFMGLGKGIDLCQRHQRNCYSESQFPFHAVNIHWQPPWGQALGYGWQVPGAAAMKLAQSLPSQSLRGSINDENNQFKNKGDLENLLKALDENIFNPRQKASSSYAISLIKFCHGSEQLRENNSNSNRYSP